MSTLAVSPAQVPAEAAPVAAGAARLDALQVLRAVAALAVVVFHCHWTGIASFGVELFFVISGFVICHAAMQDARGFLAKRIARVVPLYWLATLGVFVLTSVAPGLMPATSASAGNLMRSLLFVPYLRGDGAAMPLLFLGWTLNYEMFFYLVFALCLWAWPRRAPECALAAIIGLRMLNPVLAPLGFALAFWTAPPILHFACGIAAWLVWRAGGERLRTVPAAAGWAIAAVMFATLAAGITWHLGGALPWKGLIGAVLLLAMLGLSAKVRWPAPLLLAGDASYSLYLMHPYVLELVNRKLHAFGPDPLGIAATGIAIAASLGLAIVLFRLVERPSNRWLRAALTRLS